MSCFHPDQKLHNFLWIGCRLHENLHFLAPLGGYGYYGLHAVKVGIALFAVDFDDSEVHRPDEL